MTTIRSTGPIRISPNGRYFVYQNGEPFFWLGDTQWELFKDFGSEDTQEILKNRKEKGFSVIQIMITGVGDGTKPNTEGQTPWLNNDPATPNEAYFRKVDAIIEQSLQNDLVLVLGVFHQLQKSFITVSNAKNYAKWLSKRYRDIPNIVWTMYPEAEPGFIPVIRELAAGLKEGDEGRHLITVHPDPAVTSSSFIHEESWLDFNMIQTCVNYERIYQMVTDDYLRIPAKPTVMAEGGYEGIQFNRVQTPYVIRKQAYWSHLAGGHHSYGHNSNWESPSSWKSWIDSPGSFCLGVYRNIITSCHKWWNWIPDQSLFASREGEGLTLNTAARSADGDWALVYISSNTDVAIRMDKIAAGNAAEASWLDPVSGRKTTIGKYPNKGIQSFSTPDGWEDAILFIESDKK